MWRFIVPAFANDYRVVLFDHVGAGKSDIAQYRPDKYNTLDGYAVDVLEIIDAAGGAPVIFVGHSVSAMIGVLAAAKRPAAFERLILIGPSPCYINDGDYIGGFSRQDIDELLQTLEGNYLGWSSTMAPAIMGAPDRPELAEDLTNSFCRTDPDIAAHFARVTFLSDSRADLRKLATPALILQCSDDIIAPRTVGDYLQRHLPNASLRVIDNIGHCPPLSAPGPCMEAIDAFLDEVAAARVAA
jgi:sigma-B regulation protein RsbQ